MISSIKNGVNGANSISLSNGNIENFYTSLPFKEVIWNSVPLVFFNSYFIAFSSWKAIVKLWR